MKYRIRRHVMYYPENGDVKPAVYFTVEEKRLWYWVKLDRLEGSKFATFDSLEDTEAAIKRHDQISKLLMTDRSIEKTVKL